MSSEPGWAAMRTAVAVARELVGERLSSAYAIGSLAHGGFGPAVSDVDLALLTEGPLDAETVSRIAAATESELRTELSRRLSIFHVPWRAFAAPPSGTRFPAIDRLDLLRYGVLVYGAELRARLPAPPSAQVIEEAVRFAVEHLSAEPTETAVRHHPTPGVAQLRKVTKLVLLPVRLLFVAETGEVGGNDDAVAHYGQVMGASRLEVVDQALRWREVGSIPDWESAQRLLGSELMALRRQVLRRLCSVPEIPARRELELLSRHFEGP
jgi:predicted nucleotidyltransferase